MDKNTTQTQVAFEKVSEGQDGGCPCCGDPANMYVLSGTDYCFDACHEHAASVAQDAMVDYTADRASHVADRLDYAGSPYATPRDCNLMYTHGGAL